ncbi:hypothetical protein Ctob_003833 [Chrysochromulina tobinii]|uniref:Uncharacterized protein n=1 Tax=Chrysochromulina tobinii TaxID=1460289 RepID=A0A0M0JNS0_9EUKA|nr:hypothetical protein Ctob_003833 [Chrysochromulina tobinii]|eukprot:KOO28130.1 hypothetical protein Ctob_003833 [Chrysochromulina sp. CCMP291]
MLGISTDCYLIASFFRQALASSAMLGVPNAFRCAVACDAFERVAPLTGRFEGVLGLVWREIVRCLYSDYTPELPGAGAKVYAMRTPFFVEARRLQQMVDELRVQATLDSQKREADTDAADQKGRLLSKTLGKMNRVLGISQGMSEVEIVKLKMEGLEKLLAEALAELESHKTGDKLDKLVRLWMQLSTEQQVMTSNDL